MGLAVGKSGYATGDRRARQCKMRRRQGGSGVAAGVGVGVGLAVAVGVGVAAGVGVAIGLAFGIGEGCCAPPNLADPTTTSITNKVTATFIGKKSFKR